MSLVFKEVTNYPETNTISYSDGRRSYHYTIIQEGFYPQLSILAYTQGKEKYKVPDNYKVETTWGRQKISELYNVLLIIYKRNQCSKLPMA